MNSLLSRRDIEALSAYLDGELNSHERARVETLLNEDPEMREALNHLQQTRALVRSLPKVKVPRNFTLTPEMAGQPEYAPRTGRWGLTMRWASAIASILLVLVFAGDVLTGGLSGTRSQSVAGALDARNTAEEMQASDAIPPDVASAIESDGQDTFAEKSGEAPLPSVDLEAAEMADEAAEEEKPMALEAVPPEESEGETYAFEAEEATAEETGASVSTEPSEAQMFPQGTPTAADADRMLPTIEVNVAGDDLVGATEQPGTLSQPTPTMAGTLPPLEPALGETAEEQPPTPAPTLIIAEDHVEPTGPTDEDSWEELPPPPVRRFSVVRAIEVLLLLAALGTGITAFVLHRRSL